MVFSADCRRRHDFIDGINSFIPADHFFLSARRRSLCCIKGKPWSEPGAGRRRVSSCRLYFDSSRQRFRGNRRHYIGSSYVASVSSSDSDCAGAFDYGFKFTRADRIGFNIGIPCVFICGNSLDSDRGNDYKLLTGQIEPAEHAAVGTPVAGLSLFLLLKAFSSGCSALTGVEAISNAIPAFKDPAPKNAANTLAMMGILLAVLFSGITMLAFGYGITPKSEETVVSQIASETFGRSFLYFFIQGTTSMILVLAANTGFSAFPRLAFNLARDKYMPRMFTVRGDRLGYSNGIIFLGIASIVLIVLFNGQTEHLIPLYAVGVFIPFTLSQTGMCLKWMREKPDGWIAKMIINAAESPSPLSSC